MNELSSLTNIMKVIEDRVRWRCQTWAPAGIFCVTFLPMLSTQRMICNQCKPPAIDCTFFDPDPFSAEVPTFVAVDMNWNDVLWVRDRGFVLFVRSGQCSRCKAAYYALLRQRV